MLNEYQANVDRTEFERQRQRLHNNMHCQYSSCVLTLAYRRKGGRLSPLDLISPLKRLFWHQMTAANCGTIISSHFKGGLHDAFWQFYFVL